MQKITNINYPCLPVVSVIRLLRSSLSHGHPSSYQTDALTNLSTVNNVVLILTCYFHNKFIILKTLRRRSGGPNCKRIGNDKTMNANYNQ